MGKIGREETFTGVLAAGLMHKHLRPLVLQGLGLPTDLDFHRLYTGVEPIDLVMTMYNSMNQQHAFVVEVKWQGTPSNHPGSTSYPVGLPAHDLAPSQLDRAHQLMRKGPACRCGYPQVCVEHGCMRGCNVASTGWTAPRWGGQWPKVYPSQQRRVQDLQAVLREVTAKPHRFHLRFLGLRRPSGSRRVSRRHLQ